MYSVYEKEAQIEEEIMKYKDKSKSSGDKQYKNNRGLDVIADWFGGGVGAAVEAKRKRKAKLEETYKKTQPKKKKK